MMKRSFAEAITQKNAPEKEKKLKKIEEKLSDIEDVVCIRGEGPPAPIYDFQELVSVLIVIVCCCQREKKKEK